MAKYGFEGVCTALVTPFTKEGGVDFGALERLLEMQKKGGVTAVLLLGTTGEASTLSDAERGEILRFARKKMPHATLFAGCGCNDTKKAVGYAVLAKNCGADALLAVTPYYNKCSQTGAKRYYEAIAAVGLPLYAYNVPSRTGFDLGTKTAADLYKEGVIRGVKDAAGDVKRMEELVEKGVPVYSGDDLLNLPGYAVGAKGCVSVLSNLVPAACVEIYRDYKAGRVLEAEKADAALRPLVRALFSDVNPIMVKTALSILKVCEPVLRAPLCETDGGKRQALLRELVKRRLV